MKIKCTWTCVLLVVLTLPSLAQAKACPSSTLDVGAVKQQIITRRGRAYVIDGDYACAERSAECRSPAYTHKGAYLLAGDDVINFGNVCSYSCVSFLNAVNGTVTSGWVSTDRLADSPRPQNLTDASWVSWLGVRAKTAIKGNRALLNVEAATPNGTSGDNVKAVASFSGYLRKKYQVWSSKPSGCQVQAVMLENYLYLLGSDGCGGPGASFDGFYKRAR